MPWPSALGALYRRNGLTLARWPWRCRWPRFLAAAAASVGPLWRSRPRAASTAIFPHGTLVAAFAPAFLFALLALGLGVRRFMRGSPSGHRQGAGRQPMRLPRPRKAALG
jgi:citrate/tricarballylate utilization protein